jgi:hypothetical protein
MSLVHRVPGKAIVAFGGRAAPITRTRTDAHSSRRIGPGRTLAALPGPRSEIAEPLLRAGHRDPSPGRASP